VVTESLVRAHQASVWRHLRLCGAQADLADDLVQETLLRLCRCPPEDRGGKALAGWLRRTARHLLANDRRRPAVVIVDDEAAEAAQARYERDDGGASWHRALAACLQTLPDRERQAVERRYAPGGSRAAVGQALGIEDEGVKTLLRRVRAKLLACMQRRVEEP
jgi:RNA polymerase sigma-70 factor (ECF subfamily)